MKLPLILSASICLVHGAFAQNDYLLGETIAVSGAVRSIASFDSNTLVAITNATGESIPLRSVDGGHSWRAITLTIVNKAINCFAAADASTAVGVGVGGRIVRTTDAGVTWEEMPSPTTLAITSVFFTDASNGFATCLSAKYLTTTDAGATWTLHSLGNFFNDLYCMEWLTPDVGFAAGNGLFATVNGGTTWSLRSSAVSSVRAMHWRNANEGFVGTAGGWSTSTNGGFTWAAGAGTVAMENIQVLNANAIYVSDATNMWVSTDEGINWEPYHTAAENITAFHFSDTSIGWLATGPKNYRTLNGGVDWLPAISNMPVLDYLIWKSFEQDSLIYLSGNSYYLLRSKDLGLSWDTVHYAVQLNTQATGLDFHDPRSGYWQSSDSKLHFFTDTGRVSIMHGANSQGRIVSFDSLHVLKCDLFTGNTANYSTDGGFVFNFVPSPITSTGIHKVDAQYGFTVDMGGEVRRTTDGGQTYALMGNSYFGQKTIYFADGLHGLVHDNNGTEPELAISNDGGASWANITAPIAPNRYISKGYRLNYTDILLLMTDGTTYFSHDMGASFDPVLTGYNARFREGCLTNGHFYLFGYTFAIRDPVLFDISTAMESSVVATPGTITVYPNPAQDQLVIRNGWSAGQVGYTLFDMAGRNVLSGTAANNNGSFQLGLGTMPAGCYTLSVVQGGGVPTTARIVLSGAHH